MRFLFNRITLVISMTLLVVAMLGASLGVATANQRLITLVPGFNLIGGPLVGNVDPDDFAGCLPDDSWSALYIWDPVAQSWEHYFNVEQPSIPDYINNENVGGIQQIPRLAGVVVIMTKQVTNPFVPESSSQAGQCA
jgi:hypothetical protein